MKSLTPIPTVSESPWILPLDIISEIAGILAKEQGSDIKSRRALTSLARVSQAVLSATLPHLYRELGTTIRQFNSLFKPLRETRRHPSSFVDSSEESALRYKVHVHTSQWSIVASLIQRFSMIKVIHFKPTRGEDEDQRTIFPKSTAGVRGLQRSLRSYNGEPFNLFQSVKHVAIDFSDYHLSGSRGRAPLCQFVTCLEGTIPEESASICFFTSLPSYSSPYQSKALDQISWSSLIIHDRKVSSMLHPLVNTTTIIIDMKYDVAANFPTGDYRTLNARLLALRTFVNQLQSHPVERIKLIKPKMPPTHLEEYTEEVDKVISGISNGSQDQRGIQWEFIEQDQARCQCGSEYPEHRFKS